MTKKDLAIIILAAGSSKRLGIPKQLVHYKNQSLLEISVKKALDISKDVFVVLGHKKEECEKNILKYKVSIIYNTEYEKGIGSSISFGISHTNEYENSLIMLCDQPFIPLEHLQLLTEKIDNQIVATQYSHSINLKVPAIFPKKYYEELFQLNYDVGAKSLLKNHICTIVKLDTSLAIDIDTQEDIYKHIDL